MLETILRTKLFVPPLRPNLVARQRLIERLNQGLQVGQKLILLSAPAGFGKTTLVLDWIQDSGLNSEGQAGQINHLCWLSLESDDSYLTRFFQYLISSLQKVEEKIGQAALSLLGTPQPPAPQQIMTLLINDLVNVLGQSRIILVLDDYHTIGNQGIHEALRYLLNHMPPGFHLVITTRSDPPLPLAQLRVRGEMTEIREADLRFSQEETIVFLNQSLALKLPLEQIATLLSRTEGWVAALQLAALALKGQDRSQQIEMVNSFGGGHLHVVDYLMDEVWQRQPENVQDFWLATCLLEQLSGPLCDAVANRNDSQEVLTRLHRQNLFLEPLETEGHWYRYHHLFADMLRKHLAELRPEEVGQFHQRAADWYEQNQLLPQAVHHALASGDNAEATRLISLAARSALHKGELSTIEGWLEALPADYIRAHYQLALAKAWVSYLTGQVKTAMDFITAAQKVWPEAPEPEQQASLISLHSMLVMLQGNIPEGINLSQQALAMSTGVNDDLRQLILFNLMQAQSAMGDLTAALQSGYTAVRMGFEIDNAFLMTNILEGMLQLLLMQGKLRKALRLGDENLSRFLDNWNNPLPVAGQLFIALGQAHFEAGDIEQASRMVEQGITLGEQLSAIIPIAIGKLRLAQIQIFKGEAEQALTTLAELRQLKELPHLELLIGALEAEANLWLGNIAAALSWANGGTIPSLESPIPGLEVVYLAFVRCLMAAEKWSKADTTLATLAKSAREQGRDGFLLPTLVAQVLSHKAQGKRTAADDLLREAVLMAAAEGFRRPFLEALPQLIPHLQAVHSVAPTFVADLLAHAGVPEPTILHSSLSEPLNEREIEILRLIAAGLSNPEIGRELYLALNTVKWYVKGIFQKLDVSNRKDAAARFRELNSLL